MRPHAARVLTMSRCSRNPLQPHWQPWRAPRTGTGFFLVYDLGGGTFDAALVHAINGDVTVLAHEGVNSLGGRDLDRRIMDSVALPWLKRTFDLPQDFAINPAYMRLVRMARRAAETAKIALSTRETTTISALRRRSQAHRPQG